MTDKQIRRYRRISQGAGLAMLILGAVAAMDWLGAVLVWGRVSVTQIFAGLATIAGIVSRWAEQQIPARKDAPNLPPGAAAGAVALLAILAAPMIPACSSGLATAYRSHGVLVTARDGAGEALATTQRAAMVRCEAEHKPPAESWRLALKDCYQQARAPVAVWVHHVKPAITTALAGYWVALEAAYIAGDKALDKASKLAAGACAALRAAETALAQYRDQIGMIGATVTGAVAAGKAMVCR